MGRLTLLGAGYEPAAAASGGNDAYTVSLLHFDGTNGSTTITDDNAGGSAKTWTAHGAAALSTAQVKFGTASLLPGTVSGSDYISTPHHSDFDFAGGDFSIDGWFYLTGGDGVPRAILNKVKNSGLLESFLVYITAANKLTAEYSTTGTDYTAFTGTSTVTTGATPGWNHFEWSRTGNTLYMFLNGVSEGTKAFSGSIYNSSTQQLEIGSAASLGSYIWPGYLDEIRIRKGNGGHTAGFTPPSAAYS